MTLKTPTNWSPNISAEANYITYDDTATAYDSTTQTYDSIVVGDVADNEKTPTVWVEA